MKVSTLSQKNMGPPRIERGTFRMPLRLQSAALPAELWPHESTPTVVIHIVIKKYPRGYNTGASFLVMVHTPPEIISFRWAKNAYIPG